MHKKKYIKEKIILYFFKFLITSLFSGIMYFFWTHNYNPNLPIPFFRLGNYLIAFLIAAIYVVFVKIYGGFMVGTSSVIDLIFSQFIAIAFLVGSCYIIFSLLSYKILSIFPFILMILGLAAIACVWTVAIDYIYFKMHAAKKTVFVFNNVESYNSLRGIRLMERRFNVVRTFNSEKTSLEELFNSIKTVDAIFLCGVPSEYRNEVVKYCIAHNKIAYVKPKISDTILRGARTIQLMNIPVYRCKRSDSSLLFQLFKRTIDVICSFMGIIVLSPIMAIVAIAIKAYDKGPVLYKQTRLTLNGKHFEIYKFRTMRQDAEKDGVALLAAENDDRITPVGKVLRKLRLDELPQLFNIFLGSMSVVGPRPERPEIAKEYEKTTPEFALRLQAKAGLTGYAQIYGKYNTPPYDKLQMDLMYIANQSVVQDLKLILMTLKIMFIPSSTEGFEKNHTDVSAKTDEN